MAFSSDHFGLPLLLEGDDPALVRKLAERVHRQSSYASGPFVVFDCRGMAQTQEEIGSALFGTAFGIWPAVPQGVRGGLELARGGSLLVEHVELMPKWALKRLEDAIQRQSLERLGDRDGAPLDVRIMVAVSHDTREQAFERSELSAFLRYVGGGFPLRMSPLLKLAQHDAAGEAPLC
ncbi:MAG: sigma 54-interacting transcriptional regulator [Nitrospirota bacterium]